MYSPKQFKDRVAEARAAARFGTILTRDREGRARVVLVPGHNMTTHRVIIRRYKDDEIGNYISAECHKEAGPAGHIPCNGNMAGVCYHSMAAIIIAVEDAERTASFSDNWNIAKKLKNFGSSAFALYSHQSKKKLYVAVVGAMPKKKVAKPATLLTGEIAEHQAEENPNPRC
jgi:hypothetical protein